MQKQYSMQIAEAIRNFLTEDDWQFTFDEQKGIFRFKLDLQSFIKSIDFIIDVKQDKYLVYAYAPVSADVNDKKAVVTMMEFVCRANYAMISGNFELDVDDMELRFKYMVSCAGCTPTRDMVKHSVYCPSAMLMQYSPGIIAVALGLSDAADAIDVCESSSPLNTRSSLLKLLTNHGDNDSDDSDDDDDGDDFDGFDLDDLDPDDGDSDNEDHDDGHEDDGYDDETDGGDLMESVRSG